MSSILVVYASKHGATRGIAERIADTLTAAGHHAEPAPVGAARDLDRYDAFVIGSAAYMGSWLKEAGAFVRHNQSILTSRPVWLFSSGPLGKSPADAKGRDQLAVAVPKNFAEFEESIKPRDMKVFFGALDPASLTFAERTLRMMPGLRNLMPAGDFRDWSAIESWAEGIAHELATVEAQAAEPAPAPVV
jgi:menaquinone-dependent protoporphyrinogen oxidase